MNRIYQGKVTNAEVANPDKCAPPDKRWLPFADDPKQAKAFGYWSSAIGYSPKAPARQLFQDAVN